MNYDMNEKGGRDIENAVWRRKNKYDENVHEHLSA